MDCKPISLKIRRNHVFEDFCTRFKQKWVREKLGAKLNISFYGKNGIDHGGLRREFFSGNFLFIFLKSFLNLIFIKNI